MSNTSATTHYADMFKSWDVKRYGAKPTADQLAYIHHLGARPGKQALASAMALRDKGVTAGQIVMACGAPQLNKMRGFIEDALLKRLPAPKTAEGHTVYKLELTAKGKQRIERVVKAEAAKVAAGEAVTGDKPAKAVTKGKGRKAAKVQPAPVAATSEAASVTVTAPDNDGPGEQQAQA